jgi:hypothetical protein
MALPKIDVPIYETKLISTGKTVRFRPFLVKEQKLFLMASQSDDAKDVINAIRQVLANCILDSNVDINILPTFDLEHLFMQLRARSVGEIVNLKYVCNNTVKDEKNEDKICGGLVQIDVNLLEVEPTINSQHLDKIELTENMGVVMKYPNFNIVNNLNIKTEVDMFNVIIDCIDYIYDKDNIYYAKDTPKKELVDFIESMQQTDLAKIQNFFATAPKIIKKFDFNCPKCNYKEEMVIEGIQNFFG